MQIGLQAVRSRAAILLCCCCLLAPAVAQAAPDTAPGAVEGVGVEQVIASLDEHRVGFEEGKGPAVRVYGRVARIVSPGTDFSEVWLVPVDTDLGALAEGAVNSSSIPRVQCGLGEAISDESPIREGSVVATSAQLDFRITDATARFRCQGLETVE